MTDSSLEEDEGISESVDEEEALDEAFASESAHLTSGRHTLPERLAEAGSSLTYNPLESGAWSVERAKHDLRVSSTVHKQREEALAAKHQRLQEAKDNDQRRRQQMIMFWVIVCMAMGMLAASVVIIGFADNEDTRDRAWSMSTLIVGTVLGGAAGYLTGKSGR